MNLQKEIVSMIAKCGSETLVVRTDSQSWIRDIKCLKHANIDGREMVIIDWGGIDMVGDCQLCKLSDICKYIYTECCPYIIEDKEE